MKWRTDDLLQRASSAARPTRKDLARTRRGIDAKLAAAGLVTTSATTLKGAAVGSIAPKAAGLSLGLKVLGAIGIAGVMLAIGAALMRPAAEVAAPSSSVASTAGPARAATTQVRPASAPEPAITAAPPARATPAPPRGAPPDPTSRSAVSTSRSSSSYGVATALAHAPSDVVASSPSSATSPPQPVASAPIAPSRISDRLADEIALLRRIDDELRAGAGAAALADVERHAREFGNGALVEEREAARVLALCALSRKDEATRYAAAFDARYPSSTSTSRLRSSCAGEGR